VERELAALGALVHPNIVKCKQAIRTNLHWQIVLELWEVDLGNYKRSRTLGPAMAKGIAFQLLKGLAHIHQEGYLHRDLKPLNILLKLQPLAVAIGDLGCATPAVGKLGVHTTLPYRAPELFLNLPHTWHSDMWSVGWTIAELEDNRVLPGVPRGGESQSGQRNYMLAMVSKFCNRPWDKPTFDLQLLEQRLRSQGLSIGSRFGGEFRSLVEAMVIFKPEKRWAAGPLRNYLWFLDMDPAIGGVGC